MSLAPVAPLLVDRLEQVVGFDQDVTGAAGRIEQRQFFGIQAGGRDRLELLLSPPASARQARCSTPSAARSGEFG